MFDLEAEIEEFQEKEYREAYADEFLNTYIANQIRVIREQRGMTQQQLADAIGTQQAGVSRIENVNYSGWSVSTLKKVAHAYDCRLHISFETYGSLFKAGASLKREALCRPAFKDDLIFKRQKGSRRGVVLPFPSPLVSMGDAKKKEGFEGIFNAAAEQSRQNTVRAAGQQLPLFPPSAATVGAYIGHLNEGRPLEQTGVGKPMQTGSFPFENDRLLNKRYGVA